MIIIGTVNTVFVLRRLSEKFRAKNNKLFFIFIDLEEALIGCKGKFFFLAEVVRCPRIFGK